MLTNLREVARTHESLPAGCLLPASSFGPWATTFDASSASAGLSTFWKTRMAMLAVTHRAGARPSRRACVALVIMSALTLAAPTLYVSRAPAAAPDASPVGPPENREPLAEPAADHENVDGRPVRVALVGGGVLELVGVGEHPSQDTQWWAPDGSPTSAPYHDFPVRAGPGPGEFVREFAMRWVERPPGDTEVGWQILQGGSGGAGNARNAQGQLIDGLDARARAFAADTKTCTIGISVARGAWETLVQTDGESTSAIGTLKHAFAFSPTSERRNKLILTVSHNVTDRDLRVIAVDGDGKTLAVGDCSSSGGHGFRQTVAQFPMAQMQGVHKFLVQARDYERYEIRDVSLWPGEQTLPLVVNVQLRNRMELLDKADKPSISRPMLPRLNERSSPPE
jgi:hypothetical protein